MTTIPGTSLGVSRFVFGTAGLLNAGPSSRRLRLLSAAVDSGFTHFDTAPYYGFGSAERDLAKILSTRPEVTITTKVGLYPPGGADQRTIAAVLRKLLGKVASDWSKPLVDFSVSSAHKSLEDSLRRTGRDYIDLYLLHDPVAHLVVTDEWQRWLDSCVASGKIRHFGMALSESAVEPFLGLDKAIGSVIQLRDSVSGREADILAQYGRERQFTYGYVSAALRRDPHCRVRDVLMSALACNRQGAIIVTSSRPDRINYFASIAD